MSEVVLENEMELPKGWIKSTLDELIIFKIGGDWGSSSTEELSSEHAIVNVLRSTELKNWAIEKGKTAESRIIKKSSLEKRKLVNGDIILEVSGGSSTFSVGRTVLIDQSVIDNFKNPIICSNFFRKISFSQFLDSKYIKYSLDYLYSIGVTRQHKTQTVNIQNLNVKEYISTEIPIPPLNEQKQIVEKIDELFSKINFQIKTINKTTALLKSNKKSILRDGFNGNLTKIWRETHKLKKSETLLEKIEEERKIKNLEKFTRYSSIIPSNFENDWNVSVLGFVTENHDGRRIPVSKIKRKDMKGDYPYYGASGIIDYVNKPLFKGKHLLIGEDGANLLARSTPIAFIADGEFWVNNHAHILTTLGGIPLNFVSYFINSIDLSEWITGTAQPKLNQRNMNKIPIPIPSIEEQIEIVKIIEQNISLIDQQLEFLKIWNLTLIKLKTSILKKTFEGKLVPQDPTDEHAEILFQKIKQEKKLLLQKQKIKRRGKNVK